MGKRQRSTMVDQQNERCTTSCARSTFYPRIMVTPLSHALLLFSYLSFATCFPSGGVSKSRTRTGSRPSFRSTGYPTSSQYICLPDLVLSLSSTSQPPKKKKTNKKTTTTTTNNKSNKITIKTVDKQQGEQQLPLRTREYRRRKHEWAERYTSQKGLREAFGSNRNRWWGDFDAKTARRLYKKLLFPTAISELVLELGDEIVRPEELAPLAYEARKAAKMYVRERCRVPSRVGAYLFDGFRQLRKYGRFQPNGASYEQLWSRYYDYEENDSNNNTDEDVDDDDDDIIDEVDDAVTEEEIVKRTCQKILEKSCTTNEAIDRFYLKKYNADANANATPKEDDDFDTINIHDNDDDDDDNDGEHEKGDNIVRRRIGRGKKWRNRRKRVDRYNDLLLERITKTLERDVRKLLDPPPSPLSSSIISGEEEAVCGEYDDDDERDGCDEQSSSSSNNETVRKERNWSSRRMTRQEYHSLKLFATARKHSQQQQQQQDGDNDTNGTAKRATLSDDIVDRLSRSANIVTPAISVNE